MNILHVNNYDTLGGASKACYAINNALRLEGINSEILTQTKLSSNQYVNEFSDCPGKKLLRLGRLSYDMATIKLLTNEERGRFSLPIWGADISTHPKVLSADIIHLHWINGGFFSMNTFRKLKKLGKPVVWTFHDMWGFTGGCHYTGGCSNYLTECNNCPSLKKSFMGDYSNTYFHSKKELYDNFNLRIVTCSNWLAGETKKSFLLKDKTVSAIPNPVDTAIFDYFDKIKSRHELKLSPNKKYILFGTMTLADKRKGMQYLLRSLKKLGNFLADKKENIEVLIFGSDKNSESFDIPFRTTSFGRISDVNLLTKIYNSADVFIAPSIEDNLPNTVMEALACGTPVAAFNIGGMSDMIEHKKNGYLASPESVDDLTDAITWLLYDDSRLKELSDNARSKVMNNFTNKIVAQKYIEVYKKLL